MADDSLPYLNAPSNITKALNKIKEAETPKRFSQDFLATTLQMPGGSPQPVIPFLKRTGFLASDGTPTDLYRRFRGTKAERLPPRRYALAIARCIEPTSSFMTQPTRS